jgi:hypothetical protein
MSRGYQPHIYRGRCGGPHFSKALWDWILGPRRSTGHGYSGKGVLLVMMFNLDMMYYFFKNNGAIMASGQRPAPTSHIDASRLLCLLRWVDIPVRVRRASVRSTARRGLDSQTPAFHGSLLQYRPGPASSHPINGKRNHGTVHHHSLHKPA